MEPKTEKRPCSLTAPISTLGRWLECCPSRYLHIAVDVADAAAATWAVIELLKKPRSEERRVGKECRYWRDWSSDVCSSDLGRRYRSFDDFTREQSWNPKRKKGPVH